MSNRIAFIDARVNDYSSLIPALSEYVVLAPERDGLEQIADALKNHSNLDAIDIFSHGAAGTIKLGASVLSFDNLSDHAARLAEIGGHLQADGEVLLYGCDVARGDKGKAFIDRLAELTGADIAASTDLTGARALNGNWQLEAQTGTIEATSIQPDYNGVLLDITGTNDGETIEGSEGDDNLHGLGGGDVLNGYGGNDALEGGNDYDGLFGGAGDDLLIGGTAGTNADTAGNYLYGDTGNDTLIGADYEGWGDILIGAEDDDHLNGFGGNDLLYGDAGNDVLDGGAGDDSLFDSAGTNVIDGGDGNDAFQVASSEATDVSTLTGGVGSDRYFLDPNNAGTLIVTDFTLGEGGDVIDVGNLLLNSVGYAGNPFDPAQGYLRLMQNGADAELQWDSDGAASATQDWRTVLTLQNFDLTATPLTLQNFNPLVAPDGNTTGLTLTGDTNGNSLSGNEANDTLSGLGGSDNLYGNGGNDRLEGGDDYDWLFGGTGDDLLIGGTAGTNADTAGNFLIGAAGNDTLLGSDYGDTFYGEAGNDMLDSGAGDDTLNDNGGSNVINGGDGNDTFQVASSEATDVSTLTGGAGSDRYFLDPNNAGTLIVTDFALGEGGDVIDVGNLLFNSVGYAGNPFDPAQGYLRLLQNGTNAELQWDSDGAASATQDWRTVLTLQNFDLTATPLTLQNFNPLVAPDGNNTGLTLTGDDDGNSLSGNEANDTLLGLGGGDNLYGNGGNDRLEGGDDYDWLFGGAGDDTLIGGTAETNADSAGNFLVGETGNDTLLGADYEGSGDNLFGGDGDDHLSGFGGNDSLDGGTGNDVLDGGAGDDYLSDNSGSNFIEGGDGNDIFQISSNNPIDHNTLSGGSGSDRYILNAFSVGALTVTDFSPGAGGDVIEVVSLLYNFDYTGNPFDPARGYLRLRQNGANAELQWDGDGAASAMREWQTILTLQNFDLVAAPLTPDNISPSFPTDGGNTGFMLTGDADGNALNGSEGNDTLSGLGGNDNLYGNGGNDTLEGGDDYDWLSGGAGDDTLIGGTAGTNADTAGNTLYGDAGNDTLLGADHEGLGDNLSGGDGDDHLSGFGGNDALDGESGNDVLDGGTGDDTLHDNGGSNFIEGGDGNDTFQVYSHQPGDHSTLIGGPGSDRYVLNTFNAGNLIVADFMAGAGGDIIDVGNLLFDYSANPFNSAQGYLRLLQNGADAELQWDSDGAAFSGQDWRTILTLQNVDLAATPLTLDNILPFYSPDGTNAGLTLTGDADGNLLFGSGGDDHLNGLGGYDNLYGYGGNDTLEGGDDSDWLFGGEGDDLLIGGTAGTNADTASNNLSGENGNDTLLGTNYEGSGDNLSGGNGDDHLSGFGGNDFLDGDAGNDMLDGGSGDDYLSDNAGSNILDGGDGNDTFQAASHDSADHNTLIGGSGSDRYLLSAFNTGVLIVDDFAPGIGGDVIDIGNLLFSSTGYTGNPFDPTQGYLRLLQNGADAELQWDSDGAASVAQDWRTVLTLQNFDLAAAPLTLQNFNPLVAPDGSNTGLTLTGDADDNTLTGGEGNDTLAGLGGNDQLYGNGGNDTLEGGDDSDSFSGGAGDDLLIGGTAGTNADTAGNNLYGEDGNDTLLGGDNEGWGDNLYGGNGDDHLSGFNGNDLLYGAAGNDVLDGGAGDDTLNDNGGSNFIEGGDGNDIFQVSSYDPADHNTLIGGAGSDRYVLDFFNLGPLTVTDFAPGAGGDVIDIRNLLSYSFGYTGNPFDPAQGFLRLLQNGANAELQWNYNAAQDWQTILTLQNFDLSATPLTLDNINPLFPPDGSNTGLTLTGDTDDNTLTGSEVNDALSGLGGSDHLYGNGGNDTLEGGDDYDGLSGGAGDDLLIGGTNGTNADTAGNTLHGEGGNDTLLGGDNETGGDYLSGGDGDDHLSGFGGSDTLYGEYGNDTLDGGAGDDYLYDNDGSNILDGGAGDDTFRVSSDNPADQSMMTGGSGSDRYVLDAYNAGALVVTDFTPGTGGDIIDIGNLLSSSFGYAGHPFDPAQGFLRLVQNGTDAELQWDRDGAASVAQDWKTVLTLQNLDLTATPLALQNFNPLAAPDGSNTGLTLTGDADGNTLTGSEENDTLSGLGGNDNLYGNGGNDTLEGGDDSDWLLGGVGDDLLIGGTADTNADSAGNYLEGRTGDDTLLGGDNASAGDYLSGGDGDDHLSGFGGNDTLEGGTGNDTFDGGAGDDIFNDDSGSNVLDGGDGNDTFMVSSHDAADHNTMTGDAGSDHYLLDTYNAGILIVTDFSPGIGGDVIDVGNLLFGSAGYTGHPFDPAQGYLRLVQNGADAELQWDGNGAASDIQNWRSVLTLQNLDLAATPLTLASFNPLAAPDGNPIGLTLTGDVDGNTLNGSEENDNLSGLGGSDNLYGNGGNDTLEGGDGSDWLSGGAGDDLLIGGTTGTYADTHGNQLEGDAGNDTLLGGDNQSLGDYLSGGDGDDHLSGFGGNDTLDGNAGNDVLDGGAGNDMLYDYGGSNILDGGDGNDIFQMFFHDPADLGMMTGGSGSDRYILYAYNAGALIVTDFAPGTGGDVIDLNNLLPYGLGFANPFDPAQGYLRLVQNGADAELQWNGNGAQAWRTVLTLQNLDLDATPLTFQNFAPPYSPNANDTSPNERPKTSPVNLGQADEDATGITITAAQLLAGVSDPDGNPLAIFAFTQTDDAPSELTDNLDGSWSFLPAPNLNGEIEFGYTVTDGKFFESNVATLTLAPVNDAPVGEVTIANMTDTQRGIDAPRQGDMLQADHTIDDADGIENAEFVFQWQRDGVDIAGANQSSYVLTQADAGGRLSARVRYVDDQGTQEALDSLPTGPVLNANNRSPIVIAPPVDQAVKFDTLDWRYDIAAAFSDPDAGDTLHYAAALADGAPLPNWMRFDANSGRLSGVPGPDSSGLYVLRVTATDPYGASVNTTLNVAVTLFDAGRLLVGTEGGDTLTGTAGNDTACYGYASAPITVSLAIAGPQNTHGADRDTLTAIDNLIGSDFYDTLTGNDRANVLDGGAGADRLRGGKGDDWYVVDDAGDAIAETASGGTDGVLALVDHTLANNLENLTLLGAADLNGNGNSRANRLLGNAGDNLLDGKGGADDMRGGGGDDTYFVDNASDVIEERDGEGNDTIRATITRALDDHVENLTLLGARAINATGNASDNTLIGNGAANTLKGLAGKDNLFGGAGNDKLFGGQGRDQLTGGGGVDKFVFQNIGDSGLGVGGRDLILDFASDKIDLSAIDAKASTSVNNAFTWKGATTFSRAEGQLRYVTENGNAIVEGDINGDGAADFQIEVVGVAALQASNFIL